jgi:hypothetical protein
MVDQAFDTATKLKDPSNYWGIAHELRELIKANFILFPDFNAVSQSGRIVFSPPKVNNFR